MKRIYKIILTFVFVIFAPLTLVYAKDLIPSGENIGIEMRLDGVVVANTYEIKAGNESYNPSRDSDIKIGDYITSIDGIEVNSTKDLVTYLHGLPADAKSVQLKIRRDSTIITRILKVSKSADNGWKTGLIIKDKVLSIGTMTFYDPETGRYGALGHEIANTTTGEIVQIRDGSIYESTVTGIKKSENGSLGEKIAEIDMSNRLGNIEINDIYGIYGEYEEIPTELKAMPSAKIEEVELGRAEIWTVTSGNKVTKYEIEITNLKGQSSPSTKGITFKITDKSLLSQTNGIVQGMSGSPIIQNNMIVGAVTHVVTSKVATGHGVYIEWMLKEVKK